MQTGFLQEALQFSERSLALNPNHMFAGLVNDYIRYSIDNDAVKTRDRILARWKKDTMRFDILHEVGKVNTIIGDFKAATECYDRSQAMMKRFGLDVFKHEYLRIGMAYAKVGQMEKSKAYLEAYKDFADQNQTMYKDLFLASYYNYFGDAEKAATHLKRFVKEQKNYPYWLLFMDTDPTSSSMTKNAACNAALKEIKRKFWEEHEALKDKYIEELEEL